MINGFHVLMFSRDADADRAFLRDVLGWPWVQDEPGTDWLIFKAPPTEVGVHPTGGEPVTEPYLMCDDLDATTAELSAKAVPVSEAQELGFGRLVFLTLPSGARLGLYQPKHTVAHSL
jgi:catechol 2,3-dioxygenase-like lactoylglutathione lyase family enzyme